MRWLGNAPLSRRTRRTLRWLRRCVGAVAVVLLVLIVWGAAIEPRLIDEKNEIAVMGDLPPEWEGSRIAVIADLQVGMWLGNTATISRMVDRLIAARPAAVLIPGDFIYFPSDRERQEALQEIEAEDAQDSIANASAAASLLRPLVGAGIPTFAVLGNHDYAMMWPTSVPRPAIAAEVAASLEAAGIRVLRNEAVPLHASAAGPKSAPMYVVGVGPHLPHEDRSAAAVASVPPGAARIVMMHNPASFPALPPHTAPLAVAGHTHGGQIRIPLLPRWSWLSLRADHRIAADGWARDYGQPGNRLYVNRGIGFSTIPVRINCRPEMTIFVLRKGKPAGRADD